MQSTPPARTPSMAPSTETRNASSESSPNRPQSQLRPGSIHPPFQLRTATRWHRRHGGVSGGSKGRGQGLQSPEAMRAPRAPLRPSFSSARLCHVVYAGVLDWSDGDDPTSMYLTSHFGFAAVASAMIWNPTSSPSTETPECLVRKEPRPSQGQ